MQQLGVLLSWRFNLLSTQFQQLSADFRHSLAFFAFFRYTPKISAIYLSDGNKPNPKRKVIQITLYRHLNTNYVQKNTKPFEHFLPDTKRADSRLPLQDLADALAKLPQKPIE